MLKHTSKMQHLLKGQDELGNTINILFPVYSFIIECSLSAAVYF